MPAWRDPLSVERRPFAEELDLGADLRGFAREEVVDGHGEARVADPVSRVDGRRDHAARELVEALRAGLEVRDARRDRVLDQPVVAELEVQEVMVLDAAPVAAVEV